MTYGEWVAHLSILGYSTSEISDVLETNHLFVITDDDDIYTISETES